MVLLDNGGFLTQLHRRVMAQEPIYLQQILPSRFLFLSLLLALAV